MNYKEQNFQGVSFKGQDLRSADFSGSDLCGADFSGSNLAGADFTDTITGLTRPVYAGIFFFSLIISLFSGYIAMLTGMTVQTLLKSPEENLQLAGFITSGLFIIFIVLTIWKGGGFTIKIVFPVILLALIVGAIFKLTGAGSGIGAFYGALAICLFVVMFYVGTIARASAGALASTILFLVVALGGGMFGKSLGGGLGTVAMAISCAVISKRALKGTKGFEFLRNVALKGGTYFGTSFKSADLSNVNFSNSTIKNTDFSNAKLDGVNWENAKKIFNLNDTK